jgi:hypothetical protein
VALQEKQKKLLLRLLQLQLLLLVLQPWPLFKCASYWMMGWSLPLPIPLRTDLSL